MRCLLVILLLFIIYQAKGQITKPDAVQKQLEAFTETGMWNEVLVLAPDLIISQPDRGEGYYYSGLAMYKLGQEEKALVYIAKAESLADDSLHAKVSMLRQQMEAGKHNVSQGRTTDQARGESVASGWKQDGYWLAMKEGEESIRQNDFHKAISDFNKALSYKSDDPKAVLGKAMAMDELNWQDVKIKNSIDAYEQYLSGKTIRSHTPDAIVSIQQMLILQGDKFAAAGDVIQMENYLNKYLALYPSGPDAGRAKQILCKVYYQEGMAAAEKEDYESQTQTLELLKKVEQLCPEEYMLEDEIRTAQRLQTRYGRADRFFFSLVHDPVSTFGMSYGTINTTGVGLYFTARADVEIIKHGSYFTVDGSGEVSGDVHGNVRFTGKTSTGNAEGVIGLTKKLTFPVWLYAGGGAAYIPVYWEAEAFNGTGLYNPKPEWARNTDETSWAPVFDAGLIADLKGINFKAGVKTHDFSGWFVTLGVGFSVRR